MSKNLEEQFRAEVQRRERHEKRQPARTAKMSVLLVGITITLGCLLQQYHPSPYEPPTIYLPIKRPSITLPPTGVLKRTGSAGVRAFSSLRFFLREPLSSEKSYLSATCSSNEENYFIALVDWQSEKVIITAFIRAGEMVEIPVPPGSYKLRYAKGDKWYGEKELFGSNNMYEITKPFSSEPAQFKFQTGSEQDLGVNCFQGNLRSKVLKKVN